LKKHSKIFFGEKYIQNMGVMPIFAKAAKFLNKRSL